MKLYYWVREYSESREYPEVHIYQDEQEARAEMIHEAIEAAQNLGGWVTEVMDGPSVTHILRTSALRHTVTSLNVEQEGGAVDCFRLMSQNVEVKL